MLECPSCTSTLVRQSTLNGIVYRCPKCGGRATTLAVLRKAGAMPPLLRDIWQKASASDGPRKRPCPHCGRKMVQISTAMGKKPLTLDLCRLCASVWFDATELEAVPRAPAKPKPKAQLPLSMEAREQAAIFALKAEQARASEGSVYAPDEAWHWAPGLLGLPVECDAPKVTRLPLLTWAVAMACILATLPVTLATPEAARQVVENWGFIPEQWTRHGGLTLLTSFFLHGSWLHVASNLYFLVIFGDNVEERMGRLPCLALLALAHLAGVALHAGLDLRADIPLVGASAGISGVIAYYAIAFPKVRLAFMWRFFLVFRWIRVPALGALALYGLLQVAGSWFQVNGFSGVSYLGHLGGLAVGLLIGLAGYSLAKSGAAGVVRPKVRR